MTTDFKKLSKRKYLAYANELDKIKNRHNGLLNTRDVVEEAKNKNNPLHEVFEWDDSKAGEFWRYQQARQLIGAITFEVTINNQKIIQRKYFNVSVSKGWKGKTYVDLPTVLNNRKFQNQVVQRAIDEVESWRMKYIQYQKLGLIFKAIDKTKKKVTAK
jgi:hypothetical protein